MPTVMITGANRGLGFGLAKAYAADGWEVLAACRKPEKTKELNSLKGKVEILKLDVADHGAIDALATRLKGKPIDILINNAGVLGSDTFDRGGPGQVLGDMDYGGFRQTLEINTIAPLKVTEAFLPNIEKGHEKKIIAITSGMGSLEGMEPGYIAYRTSKTAVNAIMKNLAVTLAGKNIIVAMLHPGWVRTDMGSGEAPLSVEESVTGLKGVIDGLTLKQTGSFKNYKGETIPW